MNKLAYKNNKTSSKLRDSKYLENFEVSNSSMEELWILIKSRNSGIDCEREDGKPLRYFDADCHRNKKVDFRINEHLVCYYVESFGGHSIDDGEEYGYIYRVGDYKNGESRFFKWSGYCDSYDGGCLDIHSEVKPIEVLRTEWVSV